jgi:hypothetical protein
MSEEVKDQHEEPEVTESDLDGFGDADLEELLGETPEETESPGHAAKEPDTDSEPATTGEPEPQQEDKLKSLEERLATLQKQVEDKESYIQQRSREIGELRKQLRQKADTMRAEVPDLAVEDPVAAVERVIMARETEQELARLEMQEASNQNKAVIMRAIPDIESKIDAIAEIARADGAPPEVIREFKANPFATAPPILKMLADRADKATRLSELEAKLSAMTSSHENVAEKIAAAAKKPPVMTGKTGGAATRNDDRFGNITEDDLGSLSEEELDRLLEQEG